MVVEAGPLVAVARQRIAEVVAHVVDVTAFLALLLVGGGRATEVCGTGEVGIDVEAAIGSAHEITVHQIIGVDQARTLLPDAVEQVAGTIMKGRRASRRHQSVFDLVGREERLVLQQQGHHARDDGGRLRSTGHHEVLVAVMKLRVRGRQGRTRLHDAAHMAAGGDQVRLDEALDGRTGGRERGEVVVGHVVGRVVVGHRADGDDIGDVTGRTDGHRIRTRVAGRGDDDDPGTPGLHHRLVEWVVPVVGTRLGAERQVEHADAVRGLVAQYPVQAADDVGIGRAPEVVEGAHADQVRPRGDATVITVFGQPAVYSDAGHVGAVAVAIAERCPVCNSVVHGQQPGSAIGILDDAVVVPQAGIDHGDGHAMTVEALGVQGVGTDQPAHIGGVDIAAVTWTVVGLVFRRLGRDLDRLVVEDAPHLGVATQRSELRVCQLRTDGTDDAQLVSHVAADGLDRLSNVLQIVALDDDGRHRHPR